MSINRGMDKEDVLCLVTQSCSTLCDPMDCSLWSSSVHGDSPGKNTGAGCHALLQGILPIQGSNPGLLHSGRFFIVWDTRAFQNGLLLGHKKEWNDDICSNMDGPRDCHTKGSKSEKDTAATAKSFQSRLTLCDPIEGSPRGSTVPGILQARTLDWVAIAFSNAWKWKVKVKSLSRVRLLATPWTTAHQALHPWDFPGKSTGVGCHCLLWEKDKYHIISLICGI